MNNQDVAAALTEIAELLELKGESSFRIRAYENGARTISNTTQSVQTLAQENKLADIPGIGAGLRSKIQELLDTGSIQYLEDLRHEFPSGVRRLLKVPGVGPTLARRAYRELGVDSLESLRQAAENGSLAGLKGLGQKTAENVLRGLERVNKEDNRISIGTALPLAEELIHQLAPHGEITNLTPAGSLRRWKPTIGDIDLMATSGNPAEVMDRFVRLPEVAHVLAEGPTKSSIIARNGLQVDLRIVEADAWGSLVQHFTGSRAHNIELRDYALRRGLSLNEYGITDVKTGDVRRFEDEAEFYLALGLPWIPPELREGRGEIEAARRGILPNLLTAEDIRGDLHAHTVASDGSMTMEEMVEGARALGYSYLAITDHSPAVGVAGGLDEEALKRQIERVRDLNAALDDITVLAGAEVDIRRDGRLDYSDSLLAQLDWVIASIHSGFNMSEQDMTRRLIHGIENPHVHAIAHPTGALIGKRAPYAVDLEAVFEAASRSNTALEINAQPSRLDLEDTYARRAIDLGCTLVINTDAHAANQFLNMRYGVEIARRGWAEARNVLNTRDIAGIRTWTSSSSPSRAE